MTNPTPHGQVPEALRLAEMLTADEWPGSVTLVSYARECVAELRRLHAENERLSCLCDKHLAALVETQQEYPELPEPDTHCFDEDGQVDVWSYSADLVRKVIDSDRAMRTAPQGDVAAWLVLADGEPHHVTPGKSDEAARLWAEDQSKCGAPYNFTFLPLCPPAAPKAAPAINKVSDIIDAYGMTPGQPERVADIPGLAEALEAAFADGSAQVTGALQQGEYLPLQGLAAYLRAEAVGVTGVPRETLRSWANEVDAAARGAAQAAPAPVAEDAEDGARFRAMVNA